MYQIPKASKKLLVGYFFLHLLAASIFVWVLTGIVRDQMIQDARLRMLAIAQTLAEHVSGLEGQLEDPSLSEHLISLGQKTNYRFTIITIDGNVVCDSNTGRKDIGFHGGRPEIIAAQREHTGFSERFSKTVKTPMFYLAIRYGHSDDEKLGNNGFVRVASPADSINSAIRSLQTSVWLFALIVSSLTSLVMVVFAARTMKPLSLFSKTAREIGKGVYDISPNMLTLSDEWGLLANAFRQMQNELASREKGLLENNARLEAVVSSMIEGVIAIAPDDTVMLANRAACKMLAISQSEIVGRKLLEIVRIPELGNAVETTRSQNVFSKSEFQTLAPNRKIISARVSVLANQNAAKERTPGVTLVMHDVTDLRQLENMRRDFVANVSHELKTPLSSIMAYAETLRLGAINDHPKNMQFVEQIESQARILNQQIQDLLQLARVESGNEIWNIVPVSLNDICKRTEELFYSQAERQEIKLEFRLSEEAPLARADTEGLQTIVNNLVSNAIHYTPPGGNVCVETTVDEQWVVIVVRDTGIGIAPEHHARIFERFYRVDKARSRDKGGTGLGLAIVKHLTQSFGGSVGLESKIGKGTTFTVKLPKFDE